MGANDGGGPGQAAKPGQPSGVKEKFVAEAQRSSAWIKISDDWDGIAAYCKAENKVSLGFVEGLNNKIRVIQRRAYGIRDEEYLRLKILTCMLPML